MADTLWVTIRRTSNDCVVSSVGFDTDDTSLGMAAGYVDGYAAAHGLSKMDVSAHGIERYDLVNEEDRAVYTATLTDR